MVQLHGNQHCQLVKKLTDEWWPAGPPVCVIEGPSGVGKSEVMRQACDCLRSRGRTCCDEDVPEATDEALLILLSNLAARLAEEGYDALAKVIREGQAPDALGQALRDVLRNPVLVVWDEFQRVLDKDGLPPPAFRSLLDAIARRRDRPGRLLVLSSQRVQRAKWSESLQFETLGPLDPSAARGFFDELLQQRGRLDEVPEPRRDELIDWVEGHPRALRTIAAVLEEISVEDVIKTRPDLWETRDRDIDSRALEELERELLSDVYGRLDPFTQQVLTQAAVFRRRFKRDALKPIETDDRRTDATVNHLVERFLLDMHRGDYGLPEVLRDILREKLRGDPDAYRQAHGRAAFWYTRHFDAKEIKDTGRLGGQFLEARYHLVQADRASDLDRITQRFRRFLRGSIDPKAKPPSDPADRDERIASLRALIEGQGSTRPDPLLLYHLARCLLARARPGDDRLALDTLRRAEPEFHDYWVPRFELEARLEGADALSEAIRRGVNKVPPAQNLFTLYDRGAGLLEGLGRSEEAVELIRQGIKVIPPAQNLFTLYDRGAGLLEGLGRSEEAVELIRQGIKVIPPAQNLFTLYDRGAGLLEGLGRSEEAVELIRQGIKVIPPDKSLYTLYHRGAGLLEGLGRSEEAVELIRQGIKVIPPAQNLFTLYDRGAGLLEGLGRSEEAVELIRQGIKVIPPDKSLYTLYDRGAGLLEGLGRSEEAVELIRQGIKVIPPAQSLFTLYQRGAELLGRHGRIEEALDFLEHGCQKFGTGRFNSYKLAEQFVYIAAAARNAPRLMALQGIPGFEPRVALAEAFRAALDERWGDAVTAARRGRETNPSYFALYCTEAYFWLSGGEPTPADAAIKGFPGSIEHVKGNPTTWLACFIALELRDQSEAARLYALYQGRAGDANPVIPTRDDLLAIWDGPAPLSTPHPSYYFPILPPRLTGLDHTVTRPPTRVPVLGQIPTPAERPAPAEGGPRYVFRRKGEIWELRFNGQERFAKDRTGLGYWHRLIRQRGQRFEAWELSEQDPAVNSLTKPDRVADDETIRTVQKELDRLEEDISLAEQADDSNYRDEKEEKADKLREYLQKARGLKGKPRPMETTAKERQTNAVRKALKDAIAALREDAQMPDLAMHLDGSYHSQDFRFWYEPKGATPAWET